MSSEGPDQSSRERQEAIRNKIGAWAIQANWEDEDKADRLMEDVFENFDAFIDPQQSASDNWEKIKDELGLRTKSESIKRMRDAADAADQQAYDEIERIVEEYGPLAVFEAVYEREPDVDPELERIVDDLLTEAVTPDEFDPFVRTELQGRLDLAETGFEIRRREDIEDMEQRLREARETDSGDAEERALSELERSFGMRFDDLDDAIQRIREATGEDITRKSGVVKATASNGGVDLTIDQQSGPEVTESERELILSRVRDEVDIGAFTGNGPGVSITEATVAEYTVEDGVFIEFDDSSGDDAAIRARGGIADPSDLPTAALNRLRAPQGVQNLLNRFNDDTLETLADQLRRGDVGGDVRMDLYDQLSRVDRGQLRERSADRPGFGAVLNELEVLTGGPAGELLDALERDPEGLRDTITRGQMDDILQMVREGDVDQSVQGDIRDALADVPDDVLGTLVAEYSPSGDAFDSSLFSLLQEVNAPVPSPDAIGIDEGPTVADEPDVAIDAPGDMDVGAMIPDAETGEPSLPGDTVSVPEAELAVTPGGGKDASHFRQVIQELQGERDPDKIPEEEIQTLRNSPGKRQELIQEAQRQLTRLSGGGTGGGGGGPSAAQGAAQGGFGGGVPGPDDPTGPEAFNEIENMLPRTRFEVTQRPDPGNDEAIRTRFPVPTKRMQFERLERQRLGTTPTATPQEFVQLVGEDAWPNPPLEVEEFLAAQQRRFIG